MAYSAVKGGQTAIAQARELLEYMRCRGGSTPIEVKQIIDQLGVLVDRAMSEGALYSRELAALAIKQAAGDVLEAAFILRAFLSTLPRSHYTHTLDTDQMRVRRRISGTHKDIHGGQFLGPTPDYTKRLFRFELTHETDDQMRTFVENFEGAGAGAGSQHDAQTPPGQPGWVLPRVTDALRAEGLVESRCARPDSTKMPDATGIPDITRESPRFPAPREARLQALARGETGGMMALAYSCIRGWGDIHPYLAELRVGSVDVFIDHPIYSGESICLGEMTVTEAEMISSIKHAQNTSDNRFTLGYGLVFGHNEVKAIAMGILDRSMRTTEPKAPAENEEFVLYHTDGIESSGFVSHWKLPHYVDFKSEMAIIRDIKKDGRDGDE